MRIFLAVLFLFGAAFTANAQKYDFTPEGSEVVFQKFVRITNAIDVLRKLLDFSDPAMRIRIMNNPNGIASVLATRERYEKLLRQQNAIVKSLAQNFLYEQIPSAEFLAVSYRAGWVDGSPHSLAQTSEWLKQEYGIKMTAAAITKATEHAQEDLIQGTLHDYLSNERGGFGYIDDYVSSLDFTVEQYPEGWKKTNLLKPAPAAKLPAPLLQQPSTSPTSLSTPTPYPFLIQQTASPATYLPSTSFYQPPLIVAPAPVPAIPLIR